VPKVVMADDDPHACRQLGLNLDSYQPARLMGSILFRRRVEPSPPLLNRVHHHSDANQSQVNHRAGEGDIAGHFTPRWDFLPMTPPLTIYRTYVLFSAHLPGADVQSAGLSGYALTRL
jgi:hypothetical protein